MKACVAGSESITPERSDHPRADLSGVPSAQLCAQYRTRRQGGSENRGRREPPRRPSTHRALIYGRELPRGLTAHVSPHHGEATFTFTGMTSSGSEHTQADCALRRYWNTYCYELGTNIKIARLLKNSITDAI